MAILGGKNPHPQTLVVGGVTSGMDLFDAERMGQYLFRFKEMKNFIETAYIPDVLLAAKYYKDEGLQGIGGVSRIICLMADSRLMMTGTNCSSHAELSKTEIWLSP